MLRAIPSKVAHVQTMFRGTAMPLCDVAGHALEGRMAQIDATLPNGKGVGKLLVLTGVCGRCGQRAWDDGQGG